MKVFNLFSALILFALVFATSLAAHAQGRGPGGTPGQHGPGSAGGPDHGSGGGSGGPANNASGAPRNALQFGPAGRWWDDKAVVHAVGITSAQQRKMDSVFDANRPAILATYKTLLTEQSRLASLNKSAQPDQAAVFAQIDAVSQARAALQKATTQMLLQIRQEMGPDQVQKLEQIH